MTEEISTQSQQDRQCTHKHNTKVCSHNNCCRAKPVLQGYRKRWTGFETAI